MSTIQGIFRGIYDSVLFLRQATGYIRAFLWSLLVPKATLAVKLLAAESQLAVCTLRIQQKKDPRPRFSQSFRLLWVVFSKFWAGWKEHARLMQPATVKRWHTRTFRRYWRWKSRIKAGRPPISTEMRELIRRLSKENSLWSAERIRDTLLLLGFDPL